MVAEADQGRAAALWLDSKAELAHLYCFEILSPTAQADLELLTLLLPLPLCCDYKWAPLGPAQGVLEKKISETWKMSMSQGNENVTKWPGNRSFWE